jgi:hypothetical protein
MILICIDSFDQFVFMSLDLLFDFLRSTNWSLRGLTVPIFIDNFGNRALFAEEFVALTAIISNIFEIKLSFAKWVFTIFGFGSL